MRVKGVVLDRGKKSWIIQEYEFNIFGYLLKGIRENIKIIFNMRLLPLAVCLLWFRRGLKERDDRQAESSLPCEYSSTNRILLSVKRFYALYLIFD